MILSFSLGVSIDNILCKDVSVSDHYYIMFPSVVQNNLSKGKPNPVCSHIFNTSSAATFTDALRSSSVDDVDAVLNNFINTCTQMLDQIAPFRQKN